MKRKKTFNILIFRNYYMRQMSLLLSGRGYAFYVLNRNMPVREIDVTFRARSDGILLSWTSHQKVKSSNYLVFCVIPCHAVHIAIFSNTLFNVF